MTYEFFELPNQVRPESEWTKKLYIEHANRMVEYIGSENFLLRKNEIAKFYRRYNCEFTPQEEKLNETLTKEYGYDLGVEYQVYPLCEIMVDQLVSEYMTTPLPKKLYAINKDAINKKLDEKLKYINEEIFREVNKDLENELGFVPETENPDIELPDDVELFFAKDYKSLSEEVGDNLITQYLEVLKGKRMIKTLLRDYLIGEQTCGYIGTKDGHPVIERAMYDESYFDIDPEEEVQTDINVFAFFPMYTKNELLNRYKLNKQQKDKIDEVFKKMSQGKLLDEPFDFSRNDGVDSYVNCKNGTSYNNWYDNNSRNRIRVMKMRWRSRKEIRAKVFTNKHTNEEIYKILRPNEKPRKRDNVKTVTIETVRYVDMIGPEILLDYGEEQERLTYMDNNKKVLLPVVALVGRNTMRTHTIRSVVAKVEKLQKIASDLLFELRLAMKANDGRVMIYDTAQIPKVFLDNYGHKGALRRVMHHMKKDQMIFINSQDKNVRNTFNQFTALDLSNRGKVKDIIDAILVIEDLARKFVGISKERQGEVGQYQTASGTNRAVVQSNARTEIYFAPFDEFFQDLMNKMLLKGKKVYKRGQVLQYVLGDLKSKFITMFEDFFNEDLGIYFGNRFKNKKDKDIIDAAAQQALGNVNDRELLLDLIKVLQGENASESQAILEKGLKTYEELQAENAKMAEQQEEAKRQHEIAIQDREDKRHQEKMANNIEVAEIYANNKTYTENERNQTQELIALAKLGAEQLKREKEQLSKTANE